MESTELRANVFDFYETSMKDIFPDEITYTNNLSHDNESFALYHDHVGGQHDDKCFGLPSSNSMLLCSNNGVLHNIDSEHTDHHHNKNHHNNNNHHHEWEDAAIMEENKLQQAPQKCNSFYDESLAELESKHLWSKLLDNAVLHDDPMMSDACRTLTKSDHCYSTAEEHKSKQKRFRTIADASRLTVTTKTYRDAKPGSGSVQLQTIKQEPKIITVHTASPLVVDGKSSTGRPAQSLLKGSSQSVVHSVRAGQDRLIYPLTRVKSEPKSPSEDEDVYVDRMPITPPSSNQSSDSESGASPPTSPLRQVLVARASGYRYNPATAMYSQPIPTSGVLRLTDEEKRTFITEGYPLPTKLPLTKVEERNLKKVRRKIKNKISAQESRRKKKEYMDQLERKVDCIVKENNDLRQKCDDFESNNRTLVNQLHKLQAILKRISPRQVTAQTGTCLLVMVLCFAVFIGNWSPFDSSLPAYGEGPCVSLDTNSFSASSQVRGSRTLTSLVEPAYSYAEPWPIKLARYSFQWSVNMIYRANGTGVSVTSESPSG